MSTDNNAGWEVFEDEYGTPYWYQSMTGAWQYEKPADVLRLEQKMAAEIMLQYGLTVQDVPRIVKIQSRTRGLLARRASKKKLAFMMIDDHEYTATRALQRDTGMKGKWRAMEELADCRSVFIEYKHEDLPRWQSVCKQLRELRGEIQTELFFAGLKQQKDGKIEASVESFSKALRVLGDLGQETVANDRARTCLCKLSVVSNAHAVSKLKLYYTRTDGEGDDGVQQATDGANLDADSNLGSDKDGDEEEEEEEEDEDEDEEESSLDESESLESSSLGLPDFDDGDDEQKEAETTVTAQDVWDMANFVRQAAERAEQHGRAVTQANPEDEQIAKAAKKLRKTHVLLLQRAGDWWLKQGNASQQAIDAYEQALKIIKDFETGQIKNAQQCYNLLLGEVHRTAEVCQTETLAAMDGSASIESLREKVLMKAATSAEYAARAFRLDAAIKSALARPWHFDLFAAHANLLYIDAKVLEELGGLELGNLRLALQSFNDALEVAEKHNRHRAEQDGTIDKYMHDMLVCAQALCDATFDLGETAYRRKDRFKESADFFLRAKSVALEYALRAMKRSFRSKAHAYTDMALALRAQAIRSCANAASAFERCAEHDRAIALYDEAIQLQKKFFGRSRDSATVSRSRALILNLLAAHISRAASHFDSASASYMKRNWPAAVGQFHTARIQASKSVKIAQFWKYPWAARKLRLLQVRSLSNLGSAFHKMGAEDESRAAYVEAAHICRKLHIDKRVYVRTLANLAKVHELRGDFRAALAALNKLIAVTQKPIPRKPKTPQPPSAGAPETKGWLNMIAKHATRHSAAIMWSLDTLAAGKRLWAAGVMQRGWRRYKARLVTAQLRHERDVKCATVIETWARRLLAQRKIEFKRDVAHACHVVPVKKMYLTRLQRWFIRSGHDLNDREWCVHLFATQIQRCARGMYGRREASDRKKTMEKDLMKSMRAENAVKLQALARGWLLRRVDKKLREREKIMFYIRCDSAAVIQTCIRQFLGKCRRRRIRLAAYEALSIAEKNRHATRIQSAARGYLSRQLLHRHRMSRRIQARARGYLNRTREIRMWQRFSTIKRPTKKILAVHMKKMDTDRLKRIGFECVDELRKVPERPRFFKRRRPAVDIVDIDAANHTQPSTLLSSEDIVHEDHPADVHIPLLDVNAVREHNHNQSGSVTAREMGMTRARPGRIVRVSARRPKVFKSWAKFKKLHEADRENNEEMATWGMASAQPDRDIYEQACRIHDNWGNGFYVNAQLCNLYRCW
eukprot:g4659.t1